MSNPSRPPYSGTQRKLVLAFDVGTTFSGISYSILDPGQVPEIRGVTRYPAQEHVGGDSKIPTIIYYDRQGAVRAVGAEAMRDGIEEQAEDEEWVKAEWQVAQHVSNFGFYSRFKLHLRPKSKSAGHVRETIPPLPEGKTAIQIFADFLRYLHQCAKAYIEETHANGPALWKGLEAQTYFVLTHPNGWEGAQQSLMRKAAAATGLIPDTPQGQARLSFVTEGEASLHFCIQSGLTSEAMKSGKGIMIVDAGGGTIDISTYKQTSAEVKSFEEIAAPQCHFQGSIFVTRKAEEFLETFLKGSRFVDDIPLIKKCFDKTTKLRFRKEDEAQYIKFGTLKDRDPKLNIRSGQLKLLGTDVASFFEPSVKCIIESIEQQCAASKTPIASVFLVGGFAASEWLFKQIKEAFSEKGLDVSRPDSHVNKAVADGAVSFYIDHFVAARVSKVAYGIDIHTNYQPTSPEHRLRAHTVFENDDGQIEIPGLFSTILSKDTTVSETTEFKRSYYLVAASPTDPILRLLSILIKCYKGSAKAQKFFVDTEPDDAFSTLCHVRADTSQLHISPRKSGKGRARHYRVDFDVILSFGLTELTAQIAWKENGVEKRSPAEIVYDLD
ncbi:hypothetical protein D9613_001104 [Agrocybe pediades]|uniref:Heat shock 70 kDa protein 12A n=1 Tax=Agrocybe pediades TaxID=84607 RepID=A0A8H4VSK5_9AGAR|nr:hypothetical protein D9613_001104 [Agrocybe pediades]